MYTTRFMSTTHFCYSLCFGLRKCYHYDDAMMYSNFILMSIVVKHHNVLHLFSTWVCLHIISNYIIIISTVERILALFWYKIGIAIFSFVFHLDYRSLHVIPRHRPPTDLQTITGRKLKAHKFTSSYLQVHILASLMQTCGHQSMLQSCNIEVFQLLSSTGEDMIKSLDKFITHMTRFLVDLWLGGLYHKEFLKKNFNKPLIR